MPVHFFQEDVSFTLPDKKGLKAWVKKVSNEHDTSVKDVNYIFCSDDYLLNVNRKYLNHDYYTDIVTFDQSDEEDTISADIFISIDRVKENAESSGITFDHELRRVMIHGILHLLGYNDQTPQEKEAIRKKEEDCLSLYENK